MTKVIVSTAGLGSGKTLEAAQKVIERGGLCSFVGE
jgi:hypothetical protein